MTHNEQEKVGICLSGGGFRAALFHLGALRRLNELGILSQADIITSVSGGSVFAAHLATKIPEGWPKSGISDWEFLVSVPFREFTSRDLSNGAILKRLWPWNWFRPDTSVRELARRYRERLTGLRLVKLPKRPDFVFCATDMAFAVNWVFQRERMGSYKVGYAEPPPTRYLVADAVAASSALPPFFNPLRIDGATGFTHGDAPKGERAMALQDLRLTDGGFYDKLGLEPVWKECDYVLASDGGSSFKVAPYRGPIRRLYRYLAVMERQAGALRRSRLISKFKRKPPTLKGAYWSVNNWCTQYPDWKKVHKADPDARPSYRKQLVRNRIANIRTDMNAFTEAESCVLENHGYLLAAAAIESYAKELDVLGGELILSVPHPDWMDEKRVREALANSA